MSDVKLTSVQKHYAGFHALKDIELSIEPGEFVVMVGPSGGGKSTLLKSIAGLEEISSGIIEIAGRDVTREEPGDRGIAMVFQSYALYPHMTVTENMGFGLKIMKRPKAEIDEAVRHASEILRITDYLDKKPAQLSGGQRQRVAIGPAITRRPHVFLFDEPLSNLDAALRTQMRVELATLHKSLGATMIYVTHDQVEAMTMADRIVVLRAGRIEQVGAPLELYRNPVNHFVASFLGAPRMNFVEGRVTALGAAATLEVPGLPPLTIPALRPDHGLTVGDAVTLGIRPEHLRANPGGTVVIAEATIRLAEQLGRETVLYADAGALRTTGSDTGTDNVTLLLGEGAPPAEGSTIRFGFDPADAYLFRSDGHTVSAPKSST
ncbi:ABC transporter ATP-binding protein [Allosediminivita pacifica]|uniref:Carbohydrate ABC transporter ATP-binding protein (CUT1 family) n=1 Tax=Allosediminivita pacifica TaxID=1267769 RepID=A0A2T6B7I9_9RHOB|nr:sn-glycerol-3-phosphate ABC transporter ATP-binding protein UgpC [Allosediminivita pacifica]PTX51998.1 carbohydrate ABC transporter ATP-binding protein (CUT1 family) [Allosediminivita pacifica]GGA98001.1 ABC transporter ATP-binding protein [Allosediminivita pacifica]